MSSLIEVQGLILINLHEQAHYARRWREVARRLDEELPCIDGWLIRRRRDFVIVSQLDIQGGCVGNVEFNVGTWICQIDPGRAPNIERTREANISSQLIRCRYPSPNVLRPSSVGRFTEAGVVRYFE